MSAPPIVAATHEVANQPPPLEDLNLFEQDDALRAAVAREGGAWGEARLGRFGAWLGEAATLRLGEQANQQPPVLRSHDRFGHRIDEVEFAPAWHELLGRAVAEQVHALPWVDPRPGAHVVRAAAAFLLNQVESGVCCPIAMTFAALPALRAAPEIAKAWAPEDPVGRVRPERAAGRRQARRADRHGDDREAGRLGPARHHHPRRAGRRRLPADRPQVVLLGADVGRLPDARARPRPACPASSCRAGGRTAARNAIHLQRLKDKLGNRANASAEIEYLGASAQLVGEAGHGVRTIIKMVHHTRLDAALSSAALMRQAVAQALHHAAHRSAFQKRLIDQPLMRNVLADLALESEAATVLAMRLARAFDDAASRPGGRGLRPPRDRGDQVLGLQARAGDRSPRRSNAWAATATSRSAILPRLYREAPVNSIWEGSGNVVCLDALRTMTRDPAALDAVLAELDRARGADLRLDAWLVRLKNGLREQAEPELQARRLVEHLALALQAALLVQHAPAAVADAFCASRLADGGGRQFGALPRGLDLALICERARPRLA